MSWALLASSAPFAVAQSSTCRFVNDLDQEKYWIFFSNESRIRIAKAKIVAESALRRRASRGSGAPATVDYEVPSRFLEELKRREICPLVKSRWFNAVSANLSADQVEIVRGLPFVRAVQPVGTLGSNAGSELVVKRLSGEDRNDYSESPEDEREPHETHVFDPAGFPIPFALEFGPSESQLAIVNAAGPLEDGIDATGVRLGFLDTPYLGLTHSSLDHLHAEGRLLGIRDFTGREQTHSHGLSVISVAAGFEEGQLIGPAHGAEILAATTEYVPTETNAEEDYFVAGLEWLEAAGVDVVNVSLGYTTFDPGGRDYEYADLDGDTGITTQAVDRAAALGVVVVVAAGNEACGSPDACWYYIGTPADADSVITVGGVNPDLSRASFSSFGPTADGRIKPDVAALGTSVYVAVPDGYARAGGTSFAAPMVAGIAGQMLQVNPDLRPLEIREILRRTASQSEVPDNELGWGIVDAARALEMAVDLSIDDDDPSTLSVRAYPNPATDFVFIHITSHTFETPRIRIYDVLGRMVDVQTANMEYSSDRTVSLSTRSLSAGVYLYAVEQDGRIAAGKFTVVR